ncbi:Nramp family divalent metal transporter [Paracoccus onubensis]|uniref:Nramp family divalent metal transporter n=1 Tax=Paracoccus onubensis TaxID=1675788 RepID=UPI001604708D|nr:Nramp family divalent metal transporter [Paracoccus onubensis]
MNYDNKDSSFPEAGTAAPGADEPRYWKAGGLDPLRIAKLPVAPQAIHIVGPAMILVAVGVGLGETYMWPRLVLMFGPEIRWLFLLGVVVQTVVMMEMARWAMATGESIFMGAARIWKPLMWFFFALAMATYIWPGHISAGALAFEKITGINWLWFACLGLLSIALIFSYAKYVYDLLEKLMAFLIGFLVIGSAIIAGIIGSWNDLWLTLTGMVAFGYIPDEMMTAAWFPIIVGSIAFAGPSGMQQMWYTLWLRDKGAGNGAHIPRIRGLAHSEEEETYPVAGYMVDTDDAEELEKWNGWYRWVRYDAILMFFGTTMIVTIIFTILAMAASRISPEVVAQFEQGNQEAALSAMANAFSEAGGAFLGTLFFIFIILVGYKGTMGIVDAFARGQADMTYFFVPGAQKFKMGHLYFGFLWGATIFGILILLFGPADGPTAILGMLAFLSAFSMGGYCIVLLLVNNLLLPKAIRPHMAFNVIIGFGALLYFGALFISLVVFGALPD